jgi:hypothetical protein
MLEELSNCNTYYHFLLLGAAYFEQYHLKMSSIFAANFLMELAERSCWNLA